MVVDAAMYGMAKGLSSGALILQQAEDKVRRLSATAADTVFDAAVPNALRERSRQLSRPFRSKAAPYVGLTVSHATSPFAKFLGKPDGCVEKNGKLFTYDPKRVSFLALMPCGTVADLTVFANKYFWRTQFHNMAVTYLPEFRRIASYIRTLGAFTVGGFVSKAVSAWYLRRKNYVSFCGNGRNTILNLATVVVAKPGASKEDKERMTIARRTLARWVMLGLELSMCKARGVMDAKETKELLLGMGYLKEGEWEHMVNGDRHTTVWYWIQGKCQKLHMEDMLPQPCMLLIGNAITGIRGQANDLMSSLDRDLPYPYAHIVTLLARLNVWCAFAEIIMAYFAIDDRHSEDGSPQGAWLPIISVLMVLVHVCWQGLLDMHKTLHDPFGFRRIDVAHEAIITDSLLAGPGLVPGEDFNSPYMDDGEDERQAEWESARQEPTVDDESGGASASAAPAGAAPAGDEAV